MTTKGATICAFLLSATSWAATINGVEIPDHELLAVVAAVQRNVPDKTLHVYFQKLLIAIRKTENGRAGREFGILVPGVDSLDEQAGWCAASCWNGWLRWKRYERRGGSLPFLVHFGNRYSPPKHNPHWLPNVVHFLQRLEQH